MNEELFTTIFASLSHRYDFCSEKASNAENEEVKDYWLNAASKALEARKYIVKTLA